MTPAEIFVITLLAGAALCAGYALLMWLADGVIDSLEFMSQYE